MCKKWLLVFVSTLACVWQTTAFGIEEDAIRKIHDQLRQTFILKCKNDLNNAPDKLCLCLSNRAQDLLDDNTLASCSNDENGTMCISNTVSQASNAALSEENIILCSREDGLKSSPTPTEALPPPPDMLPDGSEMTDATASNETDEMFYSGEDNTYSSAD